MRTLLKVIATLFALIGTGYAVGRGYDSLTDGFSLSKITYNKSFDPQWVTPINETLVLQLLDQPYHYLGKGHQSFVFESEDGQYVVKFLKCHLVEIKPWLAWLPLSGKLAEWRDQRIQSKERRLNTAFNGWKIGYEDLPQETGVLAVHMNVTDNLKKKLVVTNKAGWDYTVDIDKTAFMIQRKVDMFVPTLEIALESYQPAQAESMLDGLLALYQSLCQKGISDNDPQIMRNTGMSNGQPILIDVGRLKKDERVKEASVCVDEIVAKTRLFAEWLKNNHPELSIYFEQRLTALRSAHVPVSSST